MTAIADNRKNGRWVRCNRRKAIALECQGIEVKRRGGQFLYFKPN